MMVIRAFNMQAFEEERFDKANLDLTAVSSVHQPRDGDHDAVDDAHHERPVDGHHLGRRAPGGRGEHAGGRHDGLYAVRHADRDVLPDADHDVYLFAARRGLGRPHRRCAGDRAGDPRSRTAPAVLRRIPGADRVPRRLVPLSRRGRQCAVQHQLYRRAGPDHGLYRLDRLRANRPSST